VKYFELKLLKELLKNCIKI